jgi:hypothetical protein
VTVLISCRLEVLSQYPCHILKKTANDSWKLWWKTRRLVLTAVALNVCALQQNCNLRTGDLLT